MRPDPDLRPEPLVVLRGLLIDGPPAKGLAEGLAERPPLLLVPVLPVSLLTRRG